MNPSNGRLWGIDVIAGLYGMGTLFLIFLILAGPEMPRIFGLILAPFCAIIALGMLFRVDFIRVPFVTLLGIGLIVECFFILLFIGALADLFSFPPHIDAGQHMVRVPMRLYITLTVFFYLQRPNVRAAFRDRSVENVDEEVIADGRSRLSDR